MPRIYSHCNLTVDDEFIKFPFTYGVEVECLVDSRVCPDMHEFITDNFYVDYDGSVQPKRKYVSNSTYELKTKILKHDQGIKCLDELFRIVNPKFNSTCGMHVHVERSLLDEDPVKLITFLKIQYLMDIFFHYWRIPYYRRVSGYARQTGFIKEFITDPTFVGTNSFNEHLKSRAFYHYNSTSISRRYPTIEFRIMHGNSDLGFIIRQVIWYMRAIAASSLMPEKEINEIFKMAITDCSSYMLAINSELPLFKNKGYAKNDSIKKVNQTIVSAVEKYSDRYLLSLEKKEQQKKEEAKKYKIPKFITALQQDVEIQHLDNLYELLSSQIASRNTSRNRNNLGLIDINYTAI